jgi:uncharacterized protein YggE
MMRLRWILLLAALLLAAAAISGVGQPLLGRAADTPSKKTITVTGTGKVTTVPDQASFDSMSRHGPTRQKRRAKTPSPRPAPPP